MKENMKELLSVQLNVSITFRNELNCFRYKLHCPSRFREKQSRMKIKGKQRVVYTSDLLLEELLLTIYVPFRILEIFPFTGINFLSIDY